MFFSGSFLSFWESEIQLSFYLFYIFKLPPPLFLYLNRVFHKRMNLSYFFFISHKQRQLPLEVFIFWINYSDLAWSDKLHEQKKVLFWLWQHQSLLPFARHLTVFSQHQSAFLHPCINKSCTYMIRYALCMETFLEHS